MPARETPGSCVAVGYAIVGTGGFQPVIEAWNGKSWVLQPSLSVAGILNAVSCSSASHCFAVGEATAGSNWTVLTEQWDGTAWVMQGTPVLPDFEGYGPGTAYLAGVSCLPVKCTAVGTVEYDGGLMSQTLAERWTGKKWKIQATPDPGGGFNSNLQAVSCKTARDCKAVGLYFASDTGANSKPFDLMAMAWNGTQWTQQEVSDPSGGNGSWLYAVACPAECTAVGGYNTTAGGSALAEGN